MELNQFFNQEFNITLMKDLIYEIQTKVESIQE